MQAWFWKPLNTHRNFEKYWKIHSSFGVHVDFFEWQICPLHPLLPPTHTLLELMALYQLKIIKKVMCPGATVIQAFADSLYKLVIEVHWLSFPYSCYNVFSNTCYIYLSNIFWSHSEWSWTKRPLLGSFTSYYVIIIMLLSFSECFINSFKCTPFLVCISMLWIN